jgi:ornithine cyclodeaminase/alanine dehydrogenase-like protein (mu-crystallin family)
LHSCKGEECPDNQLHYKENLLSDKDIYGDIGEIILGEKPGRETEQERIYFNPAGLGELDQIIAERVYIRAEERNVGKSGRKFYNSLKNKPEPICRLPL